MDRVFVRRRISQVAFCLCLALTVASPTARAQGTTATLTGTVVDESGAHVPGAAVTLLNTATHNKRETVSSREGWFVLPSLPPGRYTLRAQLEGFGPIQMENIVLNVDDRIAVRIQLKVAPVGAEVTVVAEPRRVSTSPAVGTVIDRQFVENLPLNGRSFQSLLELTPGVVLMRAGHATQEGGQFSVNGQRTNSNYFTVDGVSANVGVSGGASTNPGQSGSGQVPGLTALGGTNGLVAVDALQEFRIQTSTYAPEFGRMPGGQISMVTRSGTNVFHGSVFEYFRDEALDATDWFTNNRGLVKPPLKQHNFGGVLGGPIRRNRTFFFGSYEGLRLEQPQARIVAVPSIATRQMAIPAMQPYLNAAPIPNGSTLAGGRAEFAASWSDPSRFDVTSVRLDHSAGRRVTLFGRVSHAPSYTRGRFTSLSTTNTTHRNNTSVTAGSTFILSNRLVHDLRMNYAMNDSPVVSELDTFGGAMPPPPSIYGPGRNPGNTLFIFQLGTPQWVWGIGSAFEQRQINIVDTLTLTSGSHEWKVGVDFRRITSVLGGGRTGNETLSFNVANLPLGRAQFYQNTLLDSNRRAIAFDNLSLYVQNSWKPASRLTLTYGVRWEFVPPPHATEGANAITVDNLDDPYGGRVQLAPRDTPLWKTRYDNLAPRVGFSYVLSENPGAQLVMKGGIGTFHDIGFGQVANAYYSNYPFFASKFVSGPTVPLTPEVLAPPSLLAGPPSLLMLMDRNLQVPRTYQWNLSSERSFGSHQTFTVGYIGAAGRKLLNATGNTVNLLEWRPPARATTLAVTRNRGYSDYHALQLQFQRRLSGGLQGLGSYTFGRSRDTTSNDFNPSIPTELLSLDTNYGYSDYDVRHVLTAALTYQVTAVNGPSLWRVVARDWGLDLMLRMRSAFPINIVTEVPFPFEPFTEVRPNVIAGRPFWIEDPSVPGGRRLNGEAFATPAPNTQGDLPRGAIRGFNAKQVDLALRRAFRLPSRLRLQLRFEMFNLLNTPNFADPTPFLFDGTISSRSGARGDVSSQMLNRSLGGQSPLYQMGGPRSAQIAAKLLF